MKTIEFTDEEWEELLEWIPYISDTSYAGRIALLIESKLVNHPDPCIRGYT